MTSIYRKKKELISSKPMCLERPKNQSKIKNRKITVFIFPLILTVLLIPPLPPKDNPQHIITNFEINSQNSILIPSTVITTDLIETKDQGIAVFCEESSFDGISSLMLLKTNQSGETQWSRSYGLHNWTYHSDPSAVQTIDGGYAIAGAYNGITSSFDDITSTGYSEFWVIKTDPNGEIIWQKTYSRNSTCEIRLFGLLSTLDGGIILGGYTNYWQTWTENKYDRETTGSTWLLKLDASGAVQWKQDLNSINEWAGPEPKKDHFLIQTEKGELYYGSNSEDYQIQVIKLNDLGSIEWNQRYGEPNEQLCLKGIQVTYSGELILEYRSELKPGGGAYITEDFGLAKIDANGVLMWRKAYDLPLLLGTLWDQDPTSIYDHYFFYVDYIPFLIDGNDILVAFRCWGGDLRSYLVKFSAGGELIWRQKIEDLEITHLLKSSSDQYIISGNNYLVTDSSTVNLMKYETNGQLVSMKSYFIPLDDEWASSIIRTNSGELIVAGCTSSIGNGKNNAFMTAIESIEGIKWTQVYGGDSEDGIEKLIKTNDGALAFGGVTGSIGAGGLDMWLVKTSTQGEVIWNQTYGGGGNEWCEDIIQTPDLGFILVGCSNSTESGFFEVFIVKTDEKGVMEWNQTYNSIQLGYEENCSIYASTVFQNEDEEYILGAYVGSSYIQGEYRSGSVVLTKVDSEGKLQWNSIYTGYFDEDYYKISGVTQLNDSYIIMGESYLHCIEYCHPVGYAPFLIKIDETGLMEWNQSYKSYKAYSIGRPCFWGGRFDDKYCHIFPGTKHAFTPTQDGGYIIGFGGWLLRTDDRGRVIWNKTLSDSSDMSEYSKLGIYTVIQTGNEKFTLAGTVSVTYPETGASLDIWVTEIDLQGTSQWEQRIGFGEGEKNERFEKESSETGFGSNLQGITTVYSASNILTLPILSTMVILAIYRKILGKKEGIIYRKRKK
ncbi:hypothetical protein CEE45_02805 [Candidatus Heimdallarchaeota archaeon B3_Heim]|nr:MAG: hypothetical protein CEE45_02805 [Candidatus Heimdallarchaeota archaeon B3_Heim]